MLLELVVGITALNLLFTIWAVRIILIEVQASVGKLDHLIANAIQSLLERGIGDLEPINPIQQAIAELLKNRINSPTQESIDIELKRGTDGKFS